MITSMTDLTERDQIVRCITTSLTTFNMMYVQDLILGLTLTALTCMVITNNTYSLIFQNPSWSPCWYSAPWISVFLIFWISKEAVLNHYSAYRRILQIFSTTVRCVPIFCRIEGGNQPFPSLRLLNFAWRYLVFLLRLPRRNSRLGDNKFTISFLSSTSASYNTLIFVVADTPICLLPASIPREISCVWCPES